MKCPACANSLTEKSVSDLTVDICAGGCGGIWFDNHELRKLDKAHENAGEELLDVDYDPNIQVDHDSKRDCPRCDDMVMLRRFWSPAKQVEIDECPGCGGYWLDHGELHEIRSLYDTDAERKQSAEDKVDEEFGDQLAAMRAESERKNQKAKNVYNMFRFILPSYWFSSGHS